jgi:hypothetical protein
MEQNNPDPVSATGRLLCMLALHSFFMNAVVSRVEGFTHDEAPNALSKIGDLHSSTDRER